MNRIARLRRVGLAAGDFGLVTELRKKIGVKLRPHDLRRTCAKLCRAAGGDLEQIQLLLGHASVQTTERYLGTGKTWSMRQMTASDCGGAIHRRRPRTMVERR